MKVKFHVSLTFALDVMMILLFLCKVLMIFQKKIPLITVCLGGECCVYVVCLKLVSIIAIIQQRACHDDGDDDLRG